MEQINCEICGKKFAQQPVYEQHLAESHPMYGLSDVDVERSLRGLQFPKSKDEIVQHAQAMGEDKMQVIFNLMPSKIYREPTDVLRAFGDLQIRQGDSLHQPSKGETKPNSASPSAAKIASLFQGMKFPASAEEVKAFARKKARTNEMEIIENLGAGSYQSLADIAREMARAE